MATGYRSRRTRYRAPAVGVQHVAPSRRQGATDAQHPAPSTQHPTPNTYHLSPDSSTQIMLAEHERVSQLYLYNADLGEKRIAQYLGLLTLVGGGILGLSQLHTDEITLIELSVGALAGVFLLGFITFFRLIERRARTTEYLRAINRIHAYFAEHDPHVEAYFFWPPRDNVPPYAGRFRDLSGLRDMIAILNGMSLGILASLSEYLMQSGTRRVTLFTVALGFTVGLLVVLVHLVIELVALQKEEQRTKHRIRFPHDNPHEH